jgi:hypothetical protein
MGVAGVNSIAVFYEMKIVVHVAVDGVDGGREERLGCRAE